MNIDWREYFEEFKRIHGPEFVHYRRNPEARQSGYLLFPDGWMYSASNVRGPEYAPPKDEEAHKRLIRDYWSIRLAVLQEEYRKLKSTLEDLVHTQQGRSVDLQVSDIVVQEDDEGVKHRRREAGSINFGEMLDTLRRLFREIRQCKMESDNIVVPDSGENGFSPASILAEMEEIENG